MTPQEAIDLIDSRNPTRVDTKIGEGAHERVDYSIITETGGGSGSYRRDYNYDLSDPTQAILTGTTETVLVYPEAE